MVSQKIAPSALPAMPPTRLSAVTLPLLYEVRMSKPYQRPTRPPAHAEEVTAPRFSQFFTAERTSAPQRFSVYPAMPPAWDGPLTVAVFRQPTISLAVFVALSERLIYAVIPPA